MITSASPKTRNWSCFQHRDSSIESEPTLSPEPVHRAVEFFGQDAVEEADQHRPGDHAVDVADSAKNHHRENRDGDRKLEMARMHILEVRGIDRTRESCERRPERERPEFRADQIDTHAGRGNFIFAHRDPGRPRREL